MNYYIMKLVDFPKKSKFIDRNDDGSIEIFDRHGNSMELTGVQARGS